MKLLSIIFTKIFLYKYATICKTLGAQMEKINCTNGVEKVVQAWSRWFRIQLEKFMSGRECSRWCTTKIEGEEGPPVDQPASSPFSNLAFDSSLYLCLSLHPLIFLFPYLCFSVHLIKCIFLYLSIPLSLSLSLFLYVHLLIFIFICLFFHSFVSSFVYLFISSLISFFVSLSNQIFLYRSIYYFVCVIVCLP